jgi:hypothetical protein
MSSMSSISMSTMLGDQSAAAAAGLRSPPFMYSSPETPSGYLAQRLTPILPFLKDYDFSTVPFVLDDIRFVPLCVCGGACACAVVRVLIKWW